MYFYWIEFWYKELKFEGYILTQFFDLCYCEHPMAIYKVQAKMSTKTLKPDPNPIIALACNNLDLN